MLVLQVPKANQDFLAPLAQLVALGRQDKTVTRALWGHPVQLDPLAIKDQLD